MMNDPNPQDLAPYTPAKIRRIITEAERRGREQARASERTIEPLAEAPPPGLTADLSLGSTSGLALEAGASRARLDVLEAQMRRVFDKLGMTELRPAHVEHEPEPVAPKAEPAWSGEVERIGGVAVCQCGHKRDQHYMGIGSCYHAGCGCGVFISRTGEAA
jgi:hypothetical protein